MTEWHLAPRGFSVGSEEMPCRPLEFRIPQPLCRFPLHLTLPVV